MATTVKVPAQRVPGKPQSKRGTHGDSAISPDLLDKISEHIADRHSTISEADRLIVALTIIHTYFYMDCTQTPYLYIVAPIDCGKSELARIFRDLSYAAQILHPTVSSLSKFLNSGRHTAIIDELQDLLTARSTDIESLYSLFNLGYEPGNIWQVSATGKTDTDFDERDPYFPKIFAGTEPNLLRPATASRCIRITVTPGTLTDQFERARRQTLRPVPATAANIRALLLTLAVNKSLHARITSLAADITPIWINDELTLFNREADIWRPLIILADLAGDEYGKRIRTVLAERTNTEPAYMPSQAELADTALRKLMRDRKLTMFNWLDGKKTGPLPRGNWPLTNTDFGWPRPTGGLRGRVPEGSLFFETATKTAELRFVSTEFAEICAAIGWQRSDIIGAYKRAGRLRAQKDAKRERSTIRKPFISGHGDETLVVIDISPWLWPRETTEA